MKEHAPRPEHVHLHQDIGHIQGLQGLQKKAFGQEVRLPAKDKDRIRVTQLYPPARAVEL